MHWFIGNLYLVLRSDELFVQVSPARDQLPSSSLLSLGRVEADVVGVMQNWQV
jgi:hypothetical protein